MSKTNDVKDLIEDMDTLKKEIKSIKANMVEKDEIMNLEEFEAYKKSLDSDNLESLESTKKNLGL